MEKTTEIKNLEETRERFRHKIFIMMIKIALIFAVPAGIAYFSGRAVDAAQGTGVTYLLIFLGIAFVFSWIVVIILYMRLNREGRAIDKQLTAAKRKFADQIIHESSEQIDQDKKED